MSADKMRVDFEKWCDGRYQNITRDDRTDSNLADGYMNLNTQCFWTGWKAASAVQDAEIARLNSNVYILARQAEALHFVGHYLGLPAGADVTVDVLVTVREFVAGAKGVVEQLDERSNQAPGHCHTIPGRWDDSDKPGIAGKPCEWCAMWVRFKRLARSAA